MTVHDTRREGFSRSEQARAQPRRWRGSEESVTTRRSVEAGVVEESDALLLVRGDRSLRLPHDLADARRRSVRAMYDSGVVIAYASEDEVVVPHLPVGHPRGSDDAGLAHRLATHHHRTRERLPAVVGRAGGLVVDVDDRGHLHRARRDRVRLYTDVFPLVGVHASVHRAPDDTARDDGHRLRRAGLVAVARGSEAALTLAHAREDLRGGGLGRGGRPRLRDRSRRRGAGLTSRHLPEEPTRGGDLLGSEPAGLSVCERGHHLAVLGGLPLLFRVGATASFRGLLGVTAELLADRRPAGGRAEGGEGDDGEAEVLHGSSRFSGI